MYWQMRNQVLQAREQGLRILYCDEVIFSAATYKKMAWARSNDCIYLKDFRHKVTTQALVAAITVEEGL